MTIEHVILDRDGTLIRHVPYLADPAKVELLPTVLDGLRALRAVDCTLYLHTNQSGVGRGYFTLDDVVACNQAMIDHLGLGAAVFSEICVAPEHPDGRIVYRKPSPAWGQGLMRRRKLDATSLCYVGDSLADLHTARNLGCLGIGVNTGEFDLRAVLAAEGLADLFPVVDRFSDAADLILALRSSADA